MTEPYQERVVAEKADLFEKLEKLKAFLKSDYFKTIDSAEQFRLFQQAAIMQSYLNILDERIDAFAEEVESPLSEAAKTELREGM